MIELSDEQNLKNKEYPMPGPRPKFIKVVIFRSSVFPLWLYCRLCGRIPMPEHIASLQVQDVVAAMQNESQRLKAFTCEIRVTFFGPQGRLKGTVSWPPCVPANFDTT